MAEINRIIDIKRKIAHQFKAAIFLIYMLKYTFILSTTHLLIVSYQQMCNFLIIPVHKAHQVFFIKRTNIDAFLII